MRRRTRIMLVSGGALIALLVAAAVVIVGLPLYFYIRPAGHTMDLEPVDYVVGGQRFRIPKAYVWEREKWSGGTVPTINLHAVLPEMKPYGKDTKHHFKGREERRRNPGLGEKVSIGIWPTHDWQPASVVKQSYFATEYQKRCKLGDFGFLVCPPDDQGFSGDMALVKWAGERKYAFICEPVHERGAYCWGHFPFKDGVHLSISFGRAKLAAAEAIVAKTYRLSCGFYIGSAGRAVTHDYCSNNPYQQ